MSLVRFIKEKWNKWYYHDLDDGDDELEWELDTEIDWNEKDDKHKSRVDYNDEDQRTVYVLECLGQMAEAAEKMEVCDSEYNAVTSLLMDMEEIESLSDASKKEIADCAKKIENLEKERRSNYSQTELLPDSIIDVIEKNRDQIPSAIEKLNEQEKYRKLIKHDLKKLNSEKNALHIRRNNLTSTISNSRGIAVICGVSILVCMILLFVLDYKFDMDVSIGYILTGAIGAITLTFIYLRYLDANKELGGLSKSMNKLISIHNTVKIRYINNTNLLQYMYNKYDVDSAEELEKRWNTYKEEENARHKDDTIRGELEYYYDKLSDILKRNSIKDADIWTSQTKALYDKKEMVEVRHTLIGRRQKLREQLEYNRKIATDAKDCIANLAKKYPQYSQQISSIVSQYEGA